MTITLFVEPKGLLKFIEVTKILEGLGMECDYKFNPSALVFSEKMISDWVWVNMEVAEYLKLKYYITKLTK